MLIQRYPTLIFYMCYINYMTLQISNRYSFIAIS